MDWGVSGGRNVYIASHIAATTPYAPTIHAVRCMLLMRFAHIQMIMPAMKTTLTICGRIMEISDCCGVGGIMTGVGGTNPSTG